jgi:uncharacterized protein (DUF433 family)
MSLKKLEPYFKRRRDRIKIANDIADEIVKTGPGEINAKLCDLLRDLNEKGMSVMEIYDFLDTYKVSNIRRHIEYECVHSNPGDINYSECGWLKFKYRNGMSIDELAEEYDVDDSRVIELHLTNECDHDTGLDPVNL